MNCKVCGSKDEPGKFCGKCGERLEELTSSQAADASHTPAHETTFPEYETTEKRGGGAAIGWTLAVLVLIVIVVVNLAQTANRSNDVAGSDTGAGSGSVTKPQDQVIAEAQAKQAAADAQAAEDAAAAQAALPSASTVTEAVTVAIYSYCPSSNATQWNEANWFMSSSPTNPPVEGYWELYAPTSGGDYVYVHVTPNGDGSIVAVTAANNYGQQAFAHWGCPAVMDVAVN